MSTNGTSPLPLQDQQPPNVPGYAALRVAADWASAVRNEELHISYDPVTGRAATARKGEANLTMFTEAYARRPQVLSVEFEVVDPDTGETASHTLCGTEASTLFWGEAAVEKFLVPTYASAMAGEAPAFLERLYEAWYAYPAGVVQVCAIAYRFGTRAPAPGTLLSQAGTVGLVCLERSTGKMQLLSLDEFAARYTGGLPRVRTAEAAAPTLRLPGWAVEPNVENIVARDLAEFVSGLRGHFITFEAKGGKLLPVVSGTTAPPLGVPWTLCLDAMEGRVRPERPAPVRVTARVRGLDGHEHTHDLVASGCDGRVVPDSMFWTDGAVEKLMLPYYASVKGSTAPYFCELLMQRWDGVVCLDDPCPDVGGGMRKRLPALFGDETPDVTAPTPTSPVYTVTHLPRSEYATSTQREESRTVLLALEGGATAGYTLAGEPADRPSAVRAATPWRAPAPAMPEEAARW